MSKLLYCGVCCMLISAWGVIQLVVMGCLFYFEAPILFDEAVAEEYDDYDDLIKKTQDNYRAVAINCWGAALLYIITLIISCGCMKKANNDAAKLAKLLEDDEYVCNPPKPKPKKQKKTK